MHVMGWIAGFHLVLSALVLKSWRLHKIFKAQVLQKTVILDWHLWSALLLLLAADSVLLGLWEGLSPPAVELDGRCSSGGALGFVVSLVMIASKAVILVCFMFGSPFFSIFAVSLV